MAYFHSDDLAPLPGALDIRLTALHDAWDTYRRTRESYRNKRAVYHRTLRELRSYRPNELHDLKIDPADFEIVARIQAGL
jgi:hypothetical protein